MSARLLLALLALSTTGPVRAAEAREFEPTAEQLADYHAVYTNGEFQGKADALFHAWVYDRGGGANRYELRGFKKADVPKRELARIAARYRRFLDDPEHAM